MTPDLFEILMRFGSAISLTVAAAFIGFHHLHPKRMRPMVVWRYTLVIVIMLAAWRWIVVALVWPEVWPDIAAAITPWVQPINQALYTLIGMAFVVLSYTHVSQMRRHYREHHGREW
jgi:uncharacterized membrane protein YuzA (DUF378 family)